MRILLTQGVYWSESVIWVEVSEDIALKIKMIMGGWNYARTPMDDKMGCDKARSGALMKIKGARWELCLIALIKPDIRRWSWNSRESCINIGRLVKIIDGSASVDVLVNMLQPNGLKVWNPFYYPEKRRKLYELKRCPMHGLMWLWWW